MRIIAGKARGTSIKAPKSITRPTSDRVREAMFSVLAHVVPGAEVLDLFAGTGALGLEALSRGAKSATLVENSSQAASAIQENINLTGLSPATLLKQDAIQFMESTTRKYDLIFADPPYARGSHDWVKDLITFPSLALSHEGILILEVEGERTTPEIPAVDILKRKNYGNTSVIYYQNTGTAG